MKPDHLWLYFPRQEDGTRSVVKVVRHDTADLAILEAEPDKDDSFEGYPDASFWNFVNNLSLGEEFFAYGYPVEGPQPDPVSNRPVARLFRGHYQRYFRFESPAGYRYFAGELSIPAPGGLSGGPLFRPGASPMLTGIVTANLESYATIDSFEEVIAERSTRRVEHHRIISYGVAAILGDIGPWLDEHIPHRTGTAYRP